MIKNKVSVVILNWNGREVMPSCLDSVLAQSYSDFEIIVVDNGSTDGSLEMLKNRYGAKIKFVENGRNLGFAEGVNTGIKNSSGEWIALLNSDAESEPDWLLKMSERLAKLPEAGMAACKIFLKDRPGILDNTGEVLSRDGLNRARGRLEKDYGQYDRSEDVLCPSGCAGLYRRAMLEDIGGFDGRFFLYGEDLEIGLRARMLGYKAVYVSDAVVYHRLSASTGAVSAKKAFYVERNRLWVALKCFPLPHLMASFYYVFLRYSYILSGLFRKKGPAYHYIKNKNSPFTLAGILILSYLSTFQHLPYLVGQRMKLQKRSLWKTREFEDCFRRYGISSEKAALDEVI